MKKVEQDFLRLVSCGIYKQDELSELLDGVDWLQMYDLAKKNQLVSALYEVAVNQRGIPEELAKQWNYDRFQQFVYQRQNHYSLLKVLREFENEQLCYALVKGEVLAYLYPLPTYRIEIIISFFTLFYFQPMLAVFGLVLGPIASVVSWVIGRKIKKLTMKVQESEAQYRSFMQESLANLLIVKAFSNEEYFTERLV